MATGRGFPQRYDSRVLLSIRSGRCTLNVSQMNQLTCECFESYLFQYTTRRLYAVLCQFNGYVTCSIGCSIKSLKAASSCSPSSPDLNTLSFRPKETSWRYIIKHYYSRKLGGRVHSQSPETAGCASTATFLMSLQIKHHFLHRQEANTVSIEEYHTNGRGQKGRWSVTHKCSGRR